MIKQRNFGVAEARIGLSVITCLLVALGYVVVHRLGDVDAPAEIAPGSGASTVQVNASPGVSSAPAAISNESADRYGNPNSQPSNQQTVYRPQWLSPQNDSPGISLPSLGIDDPASQQSQSDRFDSSLAPLGSELRSGLMPAANQKR
jgi:hypothetical protein